jgi:predicted dehydrogenase
VLLQLEFRGGISAQLLATFGGPELHRFEIIGERGTLVVDPDAFDVIQIRGATLERVRLDPFLAAARALASPSYWWKKATGLHQRVSYQQALACFVDGARTARQPQPDLEAGCATLEWLDAARESARLKRKIAVGHVLS